MTLRVLHVHAGTAWGGVESVIETLARTPGTLEHEAALGWDGAVARRLHEAMPVHRTVPVRLSRPWSVRRSREALEYIVAHVGPHVCLMHSTWAAAVWGPVAAAAGVPLVLWHHGRPTGGLQGWLARRRRIAAHLANSAWTAAEVRARWPGADPTVLHPPVRPVAATPDPALRTSLETGAGDVVLLMAARWEAGKGHGALLDAVARLPRDRAWTLWMAGGTPDGAARTLADRARRQAGDAGILDRVRFLGHRDDMPRVLASADILVQANTAPDSFGLSFVEAMLAGRPVVTTDLGAAREVVGPGGILVPPGDPERLAAALARLIADPDARARLARAGGPHAAELTAPAAAAGRLAALLHAVGSATLPA